MALKINKDKKIITLRLEEEVFTNDTVIKSREFADREALLRYCELDTLAMVRVWEKLIILSN